tara:strand:+ start:213 stop:440 length:228 start_codon:yes stop_codon:yes gene_type:complete
MGTESKKTIKQQIDKLLLGPNEESLTGELILDNGSYLVFQSVKREDLAYIKSYVKEMRIKEIAIQTYDGSTEVLQ